MIVKTGANYQAEGGYIEASKTGTNGIVTIDGDNYNFKTDAYAISSLYEIKVKLATEITGSVHCVGLFRDGNVFVPSGVSLSHDPVVRYAGENIGIFFAIGGSTGITNPALAEGSHNAIIDKYSETGARIYAIGPDAVAIIKEDA